MTDVVRIFGRALRLFDRGLVRRLATAAAAGVVIAGLDFLGILLLVPFLSFLGPSASPSGFGVSFVEGVLGTQSEERIVVVLAVAATLLFILRGIGSIIVTWIQGGLVIEAQLRVATGILRGFVRSPWIVQQAISTSAMLRTARDSTVGVGAILTSGMGIMSEAAVAVAVFIALLVVNPLLAIGALAYLGVGGFLYIHFLRRPVERRGERIQTASVGMNSALVDLVGGIRELTVRGAAQPYLDRFGLAGLRYYTAFRFLNVANLAMRHLLEIMLIGGAALVILLAMLSGSTTVLVSVGVLLAGGLRLVPALNMFLVNLNTVRAQEPALALVEAELHRFDSKALAVDAGRSAVDDTLSPTGAFSFDRVAFRYPSRAEPAVHYLDFTVAAGESLGVVGGSGAGKSTLVDLLLGLLEPDSGTIEIDGRSLREHLRAWREQIGFVPQDIFLTDDTLAANIAFGDPTESVDEQRIAEAIQLAHLEDVVAELPDGTETMLGERGVVLSGGQRQRVGLARALYHRPRVLILDEATSALDNETERNIAEALRSLHGQMTMVVIAHRLSTVRSCDRIIYLENGRIGGVGRFDELYATCPGFARLVDLGSVEGSF